jgi:protein-L-isoaspartate(D-aspartate) O-methyltransferase
MNKHYWSQCRITLALLLIAMMSFETYGDDMRLQREAMLEAIRVSVRNSAEYTGRSELSPKVMAAMGAVPREEFVLPAYRHQAYRNTPLPIEAGQTISQPLIVALMTDLLDPQPGDIVLEVGTGRILAEGAAEVLKQLDYNNVTVRAGDGYAGWPEHAPFDGIIVTAAPEEIPRPLLKQLKPDGKLVIPVGTEHGYQELLLVEVDASGEISRRSMLPVRFVPLIRDRSGQD